MITECPFSAVLDLTYHQTWLFYNSVGAEVNLLILSLFLMFMMNCIIVYAFESQKLELILFLKKKKDELRTITQ